MSEESSIVGRKRIIGNLRITVEALDPEESEILEAYDNIGIILDKIEGLLRGKG